MSSDPNQRLRRHIFILVGCALIVFVVVMIFNSGYEFGAHIARTENS